MPRRYEEVLDVLDYNELIRFKQDFDSGAIMLKKMLDEKVRAKQREHEKTCSTCSGDLRFYRASNYTLIFGPDDFKKKASFCGLDCMEYFITKLKSMKQEKEVAK
jgi:hypothetical protein